MINIGIDFGSTYTLVSVYRKDTNVLETLSLDQGAPYIPSVVAFDEKRKRFEFGKAAKSHTGKKGANIYKAFKMILTEPKDSRNLKERGFDYQNTPEKIASVFLEDVLKKVLADMDEDRIENLVIGVPEIWNEGFKTVDGRSIVRNICQNIDFVENVQVVSEPAAASAYFAYNYYLSTGKNFEGNILLVDYGGGTLDITLTNVSSCDKSETKSDNNVEIKVLERTGAGENEEGKIGKAGVVYMETVIEKAILRNEMFAEKPVIYDSKFYKAVDELENELQNRTEVIQDVFEEFEQDIEGLEFEEFTTLEYKGEDIEVSYGLLLEVYNQVIREIFDLKLNEMIAFMNKNGIEYSDREQDNFKIALVGGFGNYYLVKKQINDKFALSSFDKRKEDIIKNRSDCEKAISLGTALLANGIIGIRNTAPYSIGIMSYDINTGAVALCYAINYKQDINFGEVYYPVGTDGNKFLIRSLAGGVEKFIVNFGYDDKTAFAAIPKDEFARKLTNVIKGKYRIALVGFSLDSSGIISIHIHDYDPIEDKIDEEDNVIELTRLNELFKITGFTGGELQ